MKIFKKGDIVWATAREPMPEEMEKELFKPQKISIARHPFYEFESRWSVNVEMGDKLLLCASCHIKTNFNRDYWINYFNEKQKSKRME